MKQHSVVVLLAASVLAVLGLVSSAHAQSMRQPSPVAVIDVAYIFKYHTRLQALTADLQRDIQQAEKEVQEARQALQKLSERLEDYKRGSPEYKALEEEIVKRNADMQLKVNIQKRNFVEQQAKMYLSVYRELCDEVKAYCDSAGVNLVIRFNGDPADTNDPDEIFKDLNKTVIYYSASVDITPIILKKLNERMGPPPTSAAPPGTPVPPGSGQLPSARPGIPARR
ncbi:MAG TPA: OmpH family outer membrane protein [Pirellulales bacterium]|nr:OmpH family outer membrane protein [Pirellulales bacterium]